MKYYVDINVEGDGYHEVHIYNCNYRPKPDNRIYLGKYKSCTAAIKEAKKYFVKSKGCHYCSRRYYRR